LPTREFHSTAPSRALVPTRDSALNKESFSSLDHIFFNQICCLSGNIWRATFLFCVAVQCARTKRKKSHVRPMHCTRAEQPST
jgi:hypothetical protein